MLKKKSKYRPVNTNPKKEKKQSSLSSYDFVSLGCPCDFPEFKKEAHRVLTAIVTSDIPKRVHDYYCQLVKGTFDQAVKMLKYYNTGTHKNKPVTFTTAAEQDELVLSTLGYSYKFDKKELTITTCDLDGKEIVNDDAAKLYRFIQFTENSSKKRKEAKEWDTLRLTSDWLPVKEKVSLLNFAPDHYRDWSGEKITEGTTIPEIQLQITNKGDSTTTLFPLKVNTKYHNKFTYMGGKNIHERTTAFLIETNAKDLLTSIGKKEDPLTCPAEEYDAFWGKYFTEDVKMTIFCTGKVDISTGEMVLVATVVYRTSSTDFCNNVDIQVVGFKTDASVYVDKVKDLPKETLDSILKEAEVDPLGVMESKN